MIQDNVNKAVPLLTADPTYSTNTEMAVQCPKCKETDGFHIDGVVGENAAGQRLQALATGERSSAKLEVHLERESADKKKYGGRRHKFTLLAWCEHCGDFELGFEQHNGTTWFSKSFEPLKP